MADADGSRRPSQPSTPVSPAGVGASASNRGSPRAMVSPSILQEILESGDQPLIDDALEQWDTTAMGQLLSTLPSPDRGASPAGVGSAASNRSSPSPAAPAPTDTHRRGRRRHRRGGRRGQWGRRRQQWRIVVVVRFRLLPQPTHHPRFRKKWYPNLACPGTRPRGCQHAARTTYTSSKRTPSRPRRTRSRSRSRRTRPRRPRRTSSPSQPVAHPAVVPRQSLSTRFPSSASQSSRFATTVTHVAARPRSHCGRTTHC